MMLEPKTDCSKRMAGGGSFRRHGPPRRLFPYLFEKPVSLRLRNGLLFGLTGLLLQASVGLSAAAAPAKRDDNLPNTDAPIFLLMDGESGSILAEKNGSKPFNPGDMAKLMTAEVIFNAIAGQAISLETQYPISQHAWQRGRGGTMFLELNSRARVGDLLRGITIISGDDAAIALAEGLSGNEEAFVQSMNERARLIGLKETLFSNSTGSGQVVQRISARDLAALSRHLEVTYPDYYPLYGEKSLTWAKIVQQNRNPLLAQAPGADGLKAARSTSDGFAIAGSAARDGKKLIVIVAGLSTSQDAVTEAAKILNWGFPLFTPRQLFPAMQPIASASVFGGVSGEVPLIAHEPIEILWRDGSNERLTMNVDYRGPLRAPIAAGMPAGTLKISRNGVLALEVPVYTGASVAEGPLYRKAMSAAQELSGRAFRGLWQTIIGLKQKKS